MIPDLNKTLRHGGMSRRGFLRAMGFTPAAVLVPGMGPGLLVSGHERSLWFSTDARGTGLWFGIGRHGKIHWIDNFTTVEDAILQIKGKL